MIESMSHIKPIYPHENWKITEKKFEIENNYRNETIFSLANGYIGMRGTFEERYDMLEGKGLEGTFINGFYESEEIKYGELAYAYPRKSQSMLNVTNSKVIQLTIDDEEFSMLEGEMPEYSRILDMNKGIVERKLVWVSPKGKKVGISITRLVSFTHKHVAAIRYEVTPLNFSARIKIKSLLDGDVINSTTECNSRIDYGPYGRVLLIEDKIAENTHCAMLQKVKNNEFKLACAMKNCIYTENSSRIISFTGDYQVGIEYTVNGETGKKIRLDKFISYITSLDMAEEDLTVKAIETVKLTAAQGFERLIHEQEAYLNGFWNRADIEIKGDPALQQGIRFNMFQLLQSAGRDGKTSMGAKGLSGEGYEGHCFWDTEMYALPFFIYNSPHIARSLLEYRYNTLDKARERAREMSIGKGALYPWRTINGEEASAYYPAGTAQVHINADIAFAVQKYIDSTGDMEFAREYGVEVLIETARFWVSFGSYIQTRDGKFCINGVTGPDEFAVLVNNNAYTNMLAKENLLYAYKAVQWMKKNCMEDSDTRSSRKSKQWISKDLLMMHMLMVHQQLF